MRTTLIAALVALSLLAQPVQATSPTKRCCAPQPSKYQCIRIPLFGMVCRVKPR